MRVNKVEIFLIKDNKIDMIKMSECLYHLTCRKKQAYLQFIDNHRNYGTFKSTVYHLLEN